MERAQELVVELHDRAVERHEAAALPELVDRLGEHAAAQAVVRHLNERTHKVLVALAVVLAPSAAFHRHRRMQAPLKVLVVPDQARARAGAEGK